MLNKISGFYVTIVETSWAINLDLTFNQNGAWSDNDLGLYQQNHFSPEIVTPDEYLTLNECCNSNCIDCDSFEFNIDLE